MIKLSNRLSVAAQLVHKGSKLCDVGTDHGYVPVYLVKNNIISSAVACDVNSGPLDACKSLVSDYKLNDKIKCVLSDGLQYVDDNEIDDILIAGMGGELIVKILSNCEYVYKKHLILNPMTHCEAVKKWLFDNMFEIKNDIIINDGKHHYNIFDACFTGVKQEATNVDYFLGNIQDFSDKEYFIHLLNYLENKQKSGENYSDVINAIKEKI